METLKSIVNTLIILGVSIAGITFIVLMIKIAIEPEMKSKYLKLTKHLLMATVLISISFSLLEIPKYYYGDSIEIVDDKESEATIEELRDRDCQDRETVNIDGSWYVVTDTGMKIGGLTDDDSLDNVTIIGLYDTGKVVENVSFLRAFSECQGTFKGFFADVVYYRDQDGMIFSRDTTYPQYQALKANYDNSGATNGEDTDGR